MITLKHLEQISEIPMSYLPNEKGGRTFVLMQDIRVVLSDGYVITLTEGSKTDLISVPKCLWSLCRPIDKAFIGDLIHDWLWINKEGQIKHFGNAYQARLFADNERKKWRMAIAPELKTKTIITHFVIRVIGGLYYSGQKKIPY